MKLRLSLGLLLLTLSATGWAQTAPLPDWDTLSPQQREALIAPVRDRWNDAPAPQRERMLQHGQRWLTMTPEQRAQAHRGRHRFENMTPEQREQARALFGQMRSMSPEQRQDLRDRWARMTPDERKAWLKAIPAPAAPPPKR